MNSEYHYSYFLSAALAHNRLMVMLIIHVISHNILARLFGKDVFKYLSVLVSWFHLGQWVSS